MFNYIKYEDKISSANTTMETNNKNRINRKTPHISVSRVSTVNNHTGSWRYLTPIVETKTSPCEAACPLAIPISEFIAEIENGNIDKAAQLLRYENPMPAICGRVCVHPCEEKCSRGKFDRSLAIHLLERYAGDYFPLQSISPSKKMNQKIAIIGAGPSGLAACYFLSILGYNVTIFETNEKAGGLLRYGIPEYRLPEKILNTSIDEILSYGSNLLTGQKLGGNLSFEKMKSFDAVFLATGAAASKKLKFENNEDNIPSGLDVLNWIHQGNHHKIGNNVIIIGGGNTAIDVSRSLLRLGKKPVILYRREIDDMPAFSQEINEAVREGIEIKTGVIVKELLKTDGSLAGAKCVKVTFDRSKPELKNILREVEGSEFYMEADQLVSAVGEFSDLTIFPDEIQKSDGSIVIDNFEQTNITKFFAGGDLVSQPHLVVHALASGKRAAVSIDAIINNFDLNKMHPSITVGGNGISFRKYLYLKEHMLQESNNINFTAAQIIDIDEINLNYFKPSERTREKILSIPERKNSFNEIHFGYQSTDARVEANRCFHCGKCTHCDNCNIFCPDVSVINDIKKENITIDYDYCKGCGICAEECPRGVIQMKREV